MKMKRLAYSVALSCACCSFFSTAIANEHVNAVDQEALQKELQQMKQTHEAYEAELKKMQQLRKKYEASVASGKPDSDTYRALKAAIDRIHFYGFFRAKYDHDDRDGNSVGSGDNNKHFYLDFEATLKVTEQWDAHFQSETRKGYTSNQSWRNGDSGSSDQDGTIQRIWVEGHVNDLGVTLGTKWWGYGFQNVPFGHAADGAQLDMDFGETWNAKAFWLRPRQGDLVSMPNGSDISIAGLNFTGNLAAPLATSWTFAGNHNDNDAQKMSRMVAGEFQLKAIEDVTLTGTFVWTNADDYNTSQAYRIDYKATDLAEAGSYNLYVRYIDFERYGDYSHDDEWGSLPSDARGWIAGVKYVLADNIIWETFYSVQERNRAQNDTHDRDLFRTQIDFHF